MINYTFETLNDLEFEEFSKDLLSSELGLELKTYRAGADQGIDLKAIGDSNQKIIGQVKHYVKSSFSNLKTALKEEVKKMKDKEVDRYLLVTSFDLSVKNVEEVMEVMEGLIVEENDIFDLKRINTIMQKDKNLNCNNKLN